jgi:hypothetical protein
MAAEGFIGQLDGEVVSVIIFGAVSFVAFVFTVRWIFVNGFGFSSVSGSVNSSKDACHAANAFIDKLNRVRQKIALLEPYTTEYVHVFQSTGWVQIISMFESLELAEIELDRRIKSRNYDGAVDLSRFLCSHDPLVADDFIGHEGFHFVSLVMWERQLLEHLTELLDELQKAAETMAGIGVVRKRERAPTLMTVEAIRRELMAMKAEWEEQSAS